MNSTTFNVGDQVKITTKNPQDNKTTTAAFEGVVIAIRGQGSGKTFTVRKLASDKVAVERIIPRDSPSIESIKVIKSSQVRRAKLYYLRKKK